MEQWYIRHCEGHDETRTKVFVLMMDCYQIWIRGTVAGFICHLKDPFNVVLESDETQILITKRGDSGFCRSAPLNTDVIERQGAGGGGQVSEKEIMTLFAK